MIGNVRAASDEIGKLSEDIGLALSLAENLQAEANGGVAELQGYVMYEVNKHTQVLTDLAVTRSNMLTALGGPRLSVSLPPEAKVSIFDCALSYHSCM